MLVQPNLSAGIMMLWLVVDKQCEFYKLRKNDPPCNGEGHNQVQISKTVELLADCKAVLVSQIGSGAVQALSLKEIKP